MRVLIVSSYPPRHCGIGAYAHAQAERLRAQGHEVTVLSPPDGSGDVRTSFDAGAPFLEAKGIGGDFDRILVHFQPSLYFQPRAPIAKVLTAFGLRALVRSRKQTEILVHEADPPVRWRPDYVLLRSAFRRARLLFHTEAERAVFEREYRIRADAAIVPHTEGVQVSSISREEARRRVGADTDDLLFVCAGFLHPHKGFERAIAAWNMAGMPGRLAIVGSVRDMQAENIAYRVKLSQICEGVERLELIDDFLSDEEFDAWIAAADLLVLPYRRSFSSGVLARAQRLGTPAVVAAVGGLPEQAGPNDVVFSSDDELVAVIAGKVAARR